MTHRSARLCVAFLLALAIPGTGVEVPLLGPEELKRDSTHIVVGKLKEVYRSVERDGDFVRTLGIAEILVEKIEKGVGPREDEVLYVRFWNQSYVGKGNPPPGSGGHDVPKKGEVIRAHAKRDRDGGYEALLPNGMELADRPAKRPR